MTQNLTSMKTGHVGLNVSDLNRSTKFYQEVFGLEMMHESQDKEHRFVFLGSDGQLVLTLWQQSEGSFKTNLPGLHHLSFQASNVDEVREMESKLKALDVKFLYEGIVPHSEEMSSGGIFFEDPDGIRLEIYTPSGVEEENPTPGVPTCGFF